MNLSNVSGMLFKKFKLFATKKCKNYGKKFQVRIPQSIEPVCWVDSFKLIFM